MADIDYDKLADAFARGLKRSQGGSGGWGGGGGYDPAKGASDSLGKLKDSVTPTAASFDAIKNQIQNSVGVWRDLSKVGANFTNDIVGMTLAAKEARMELTEFADVVGQSAKVLAGLGGSVTRGVEAFAKLAKEFQDTEFTRELMNLGYTTKEINETLAINLGFQKATAKMDDESRKKSLDSAYKLAVEMDALAKMTGQSREEQAKTLREAQRDAAIESKFRLIGAKEGPEAEKKARAAFAKEYAAAEAKGMGQLYKDIFTKGVPASEEAATQMALYGRAAKETAESAKLLGKGLDKEAAEATKRADVANLQNQSNKTILAMGAFGEMAGAAGKAAQQTISANDTLYQSVKSVADTNKILLNSQKGYAEALDLLQKDVRASQLGMDKAGEGAKKVGGAIEGIVGTEKAIKDAAAGIASSMKVADDSGKSIASTLNTVGEELGAAAKGLGSVRERIEEEAKKGISPSYAKEKGAPGVVGQVAKGALETTKTAGAVGQDIIEEGGKALGPANKPIPESELKPATEKPKGFASGTLGVNGKLFENFGDKELVELHGVESVMTPEQLQDIVEKTANSALKGAAKVSQFAGFDVKSIGKDIQTAFSSIKTTSSTTVSGGGEKTTRSVMDDSAKAAQAKLDELDKSFGEIRRKVTDQVNAQLKAEGKQDMPFREKNKIFAEQIKEAKVQYEAEASKLRETIEAGTKWETSYKKDAAEGTKKITEEEVSSKKAAIAEAKKAIEEETSYTKQTADKKKNIRKTELDEAVKQAELSKDIVGKSVAGMSEDAIADMIKKSGADMSNFYIDSTKKGEAILKSFATDYVDSAKSKGATSSAKVSITSEARPAEENAQAAMIERSKSFGKINLNEEQKKVYDEMLSLSSGAAKERLQQLQDEQKAAQATNKETAKARDAIEEKYEKEGKLSELANDAEYKRLTEQLNASAALSETKKKEVKAAVQAEETRASLAKITGEKVEDLKAVQTAATEELSQKSKEAADEVKKNAELTKSSVIKAVPAEEVKKTSKDFAQGLTQTQKDYFNVLKEQDADTLKLKQDGYKRQVNEDVAKIKEADSKIADIKAQLATVTDEKEKKKLGRQLMRLEEEKSIYEDTMKYSEESLEAVEAAIAAKKEEIKATEQVATVTDQKVEQAKVDAKATEDLVGKVAAAKEANEAAEKKEIENKLARARLKEELAAKTPKVDASKVAEPKKAKPSSADQVRAKAVTKDGKINLNALNLPGMSGMGYEMKAAPKKEEAAAQDAKTGAKQVATDVEAKKKEEDAKKTAQAEQAKGGQKPGGQAASSKDAVPAAKKSATLDDVLGSLNRLNSQMGQLITQQADLLGKQIKTTRTAGSTNLYDRVTP